MKRKKRIRPRFLARLRGQWDITSRGSGGEVGGWLRGGVLLHLLLSMLGIMLSFTHFLCVCAVFFRFCPRSTVLVTHSCGSAGLLCLVAADVTELNITFSPVQCGTLLSSLSHTLIHPSVCLSLLGRNSAPNSSKAKSVMFRAHSKSYQTYCLLQSNSINNYFTYCSSSIFVMFPLTF